MKEGSPNNFNYQCYVLLLPYYLYCYLFFVAVTWRNLDLNKSSLVGCFNSLSETWTLHAKCFNIMTVNHVNSRKFLNLNYCSLDGNVGAFMLCCILCSIHWCLSAVIFSLNWSSMLFSWIQVGLWASPCPASMGTHLPAGDSSGVWPGCRAGEGAQI